MTKDSLLVTVLAVLALWITILVGADTGFRQRFDALEDKISQANTRIINLENKR